jgi:protein-L-isoaspartate(D-aspartate) O-methyltransferase
MDYSEERNLMVLTQIKSRGITNVRLLKAMKKVPRHEFVPEPARKQAYLDMPLPIGYGQTISQPYIVALIMDSLDIKKNSRVLDIGTGSGYQTALMAELSGKTYTIELEPNLAREAEQTLKRLGYMGIKFRTGDGSRGWPEFAPFDCIAVAAAAPAVPPSLLDQLSDDGRLVIPLGKTGSQDLFLFEKRGLSYRKKALCACAFVPLIEAEGWETGG